MNMVMVLLSVGLGQTLLSPGPGRTATKDNFAGLKRALSPQDMNLSPVWGVKWGYIVKVVRDPVNDSTFYATNGYEIFKTVNGGGSWRRLSLKNPFPLDICSPSANTIVFYSQYQGMMYSRDGGDNFQNAGAVPTGMIQGVLSPGGNGWVYFVGLESDTGPMVCYVSPDLNNWTPYYINIAGMGPAGPRCLWAQGSDLLLGLGGIGGFLESYDSLLVLQSTDAGITWNPFFHSAGGGNVNDIAVIPSTNYYMVIATDAGVFYDVVITPYPSGYLDYPAAQAVYGRARGDTLDMLLGIDGSDPGIRYVSLDGLTVIDSGSLYDKEGVTSIEGKDPLLAGTAGLGLIKSANMGQSWLPANDSLLAWNCQAPTARWSDDTLIYSLDISGRMVKSTGGGTNWSMTNLNPWGYGVAVAAYPQDPSTVYAAAFYADTGFGTIQRSTDGGQTWEGMGGVDSTAIIPVYLRVDPGDPDVLWAVRLDLNNGMIAARSQDGGTTWQYYPGLGAYCMDVDTAGNAIWGCENGLFWGTSPPWNGVGPLSNKFITSVFYNRHDGFVYATDSTGRLWRGVLEDSASWEGIMTLPGGRIYMGGGDADGFGDIALLFMRYTTPIIVYSTDGGRTWAADSAPGFNLTSLDIVDTGQVILGTAGRGLCRTDMIPSEPLSFVVNADPQDAQLGDLVRITAQANVWIPSVPACTLFMDAGDTLEIPLVWEDSASTVFNGEFTAEGLHEGHGVIQVKGVDRFGRPGSGQTDFQLGQGPGEFMPGDSVYVYPNPAPTADYPDKVYFKVFTGTEADVYVVLYDLEGKPAANAHARVTGYDASAAVALDLKDVPSGIYIWRLLARAVNGKQEDEKTGKLAIRK